MLWKRLLAGAGQNHWLRAVAVLLWVLWWESRDKSYNFVNKILLKQSNKFTSFSKTVFYIRLVKTCLIRSRKPEQDQSMDRYRSRLNGVPQTLLSKQIFITFYDTNSVSFSPHLKFIPVESVYKPVKEGK